jgi:hypothetical protein
VACHPTRLDSLAVVPLPGSFLTLTKVYPSQEFSNWQLLLVGNDIGEFLVLETLILVLINGLVVGDLVKWKNQTIVSSKIRF